MKTSKMIIIKIIFILLLIIGLSVTGANQQASAQQVSVSFQLFYDQLNPYGRWIEYPSYGQVWLPNVEPGFRPYFTAGYWVFTDYGWTWVSDYSWGWAPFHYGRWLLDPALGWIWVPGTEWSPSWVIWRHSPGFYGWAPLAPGISLSIAFGNSYFIPDARWIFVQDRHIGSRHIDKYYINSSRNLSIIKNSSVIINNRFDNNRKVTYIGGPDRFEVEKIRGKKLSPAIIHDYNTPGQSMRKGNLWIYKPNVNDNKLGHPNQIPVKPYSTNNNQRIERNQNNQHNDYNNVNPSNNHNDRNKGGEHQRHHENQSYKSKRK